MLEKKWVAFQLLTALSHARSQGIAHGDIKSENILVTSSLWVYITDFSSPFKPTMLPLDDPAEFSYFFDSSGRRTCYLAPERFYPSSQKGAASLTSVANADGAQTKTHEAAKGKVSEAMDVFSAGCVLAELFCDGVPPFSLSQLFRYRNGEYTSELEVYLSQIEDKDIRVREGFVYSPDSTDSRSEHVQDNAFSRPFSSSWFYRPHRKLCVPFFLADCASILLGPPVSHALQSSYACPNFRYIQHSFTYTNTSQP